MNTANAGDRPKHDNRRACPKSRPGLEEFIRKGQADFSSIAETIRLLQLDGELEKEQKKQRLNRLIADFINFRHLTAHNRVNDLYYLQMMAAFVHYCKQKVSGELSKTDSECATPVSGDMGSLASRPKGICSPKTTKILPCAFPRMSDINVVVCATWYFNINAVYGVDNSDGTNSGGTNSDGKIVVNRKKLVENLNGYVKKSSFSGYTFSVVDKKIEVEVKTSDKNKVLNRKTLKNFVKEFKNSVDSKVEDEQKTKKNDDKKEADATILEKLAESLKTALDKQVNNLVRSLELVEVTKSYDEKELDRTILKELAKRLEKAVEVEVTKSYDEKEMDNILKALAERLKKAVEDEVTKSYNKKELDRTMLKELVGRLENVEYTPGEIDEFKKMYDKAVIIAKVQFTDTEAALNDLEIDCVCTYQRDDEVQNVDLAQTTRRLQYD